jgi:hypothetical protein
VDFLVVMAEVEYLAEMVEIAHMELAEMEEEALRVKVVTVELDFYQEDMVE